VVDGLQLTICGRHEGQSSHEVSECHVSERETEAATLKGLDGTSRGGLRLGLDYTLPHGVQLAPCSVTDLKSRMT
jgi:hypothetical protein